MAGLLGEAGNLGEGGSWCVSRGNNETKGGIMPLSIDEIDQGVLARLEGEGIPGVRIGGFAASERHYFLDNQGRLFREDGGYVGFLSLGALRRYSTLVFAF
jgi:hypothetical protein